MIHLIIRTIVQSKNEGSLRFSHRIYVGSMDTSGSIRSSNKAGKSGVRFAHIEPALLAQAKQFLESFQFDFRIRQPLFPEKMQETIGKNVYYVLGNEYKFEPGFLICMPGTPTIFVNGRFQFGFHIRLRLHASIHQHGAIFIGTLDTIQAQLRIEDVWYFTGKPISRTPYSERYKTLQYFFESCFVQDYRLSGLQVKIAEPTPLATFKEKVTSNEYHSIDLVPEQGGRRRWLIQLSAPPTAPMSAQAAANFPSFPAFMPTGTAPSGIVTAADKMRADKLQTTTTSISTKKPTTAVAEKVVGMPDTYDLTDMNGLALGRAAVQNAQVSLSLRGITQRKIHVNIQWYEEFERFRITGLQQQGQKEQGQQENEKMSETAAQLQPSLQEDQD